MHARWSWLAVGMGLLVLIVALCQYARSTLTVRLAVRRDPALVPILTSAPAQRQLARATGPDKAFRWRRLRWRDENGRIAEGALRTALAQREANIAFWAGRRLTAGIDRSHWAHRGPNNVGGRTRSLIIDPKNADRMWAGSVSGGIWYSSDRGTSWAPVNDWLPNLAVCCLAIDPRNPQFMYAGTGEGFFNGDALGGAGIYKSTDGGSTWSQLPATANWDNVNRLAVSPADSNVLLAAKRYGGILRSTDGGASWTTRISAQGSFYVAFNPTNPSRAIGQLIDYDWGTSQWFHRAVYSTDGGVSWLTAAGLDRVNDFGGRIELAYAPSQPDIVYASCAADGGKIWRSTDGGQSYTQQTTSGSSGVSWYANPLWVDPTNPNTLVTGGYNLLKSTDGGVSLVQISDGYIMTDQPHVDIHYFTQDPGFNGAGNRRFYVCTDGGMWCTDDIYNASRSSGWYKREQVYRTTQFYGAAGYGPTDLIIGGTQDNGTLRSTSDTASMMFGGDGGFCAIDPTNPSYCYGEYVSLQIHRSTNGGLSAGYIYSGITDAGSQANFIAPFILDPNNPNTLLAGGRSLWRSTNVKAGQPTWQAVRPAGSDNISAVAVAPGHSDIVWIGQNNGEVHKTVNGTAGSPTWSAVDDNQTKNPLPNRYVERILVDPDDSNTVYVALGGFSGDNLWKTADGGQTWQDITGTGLAGLPSAPINGLARHPQVATWLYVGTEVGIFATADGGNTWSTSNDGPANVSVDELMFMHQSTRLLAATHGRGLFTIDVPAWAPADFDHDGDVDLTDFGHLQVCLGASGTAPQAGCEDADLDNDRDVDTADVTAFRACFAGAGVQVDIQCGR